MKRNVQNEDRLDREREKHLKDIEDIERRLKNWKFGPEPAALAQENHLETEQEIMELISEANTSVVYFEAEKLLIVMLLKRDQSRKQLELISNQVTLLNNEIQNKLIHRMDAEDIRYSVYKKILAVEKEHIHTNAADAYTAIVESLVDIGNLKKTLKGVGESSSLYNEGFLSVSKIIHSTFYQAKVKAKLCYEECFSRFLALGQKMANKENFNHEIVNEFQRQKIIASRSSHPLQGG